MIAGRIFDKLISPSSALRVDRSRCLKMRFAESGCSRCVAVCPASAINLHNGLAVNGELCTGCLTCTTTCPSGALEADGDFPAILQALAGHRLPVFVIGCRVSGPRSHKQLPCLGMLSPEHLVALFVKSTSLIHLAVHACAGCVAGSMQEHLAARLDETARATGLPLHQRIRLVTSEQDIGFREEALDRRSFFTSLRSIAFQGVAAALAPACPEKACTNYRDKTLPERRVILQAALATLPAAEAGALHSAFTFTATFSDVCDSCLGCVRACPTAAISETDGGYPSFGPSRCTGCRLCMEFCLSEAVEVNPCAEDTESKGRNAKRIIRLA